MALTHDTAELARSAATPDALVNHMRDQLTGLLQPHGCRFGYGTLLGHPPRLQQDGTVTSGHSHWDVDQFGLPDQEVELRTPAGRRPLLRTLHGPARGAGPSLQARLVAVTLTDQVGAALNTARPPGDNSRARPSRQPPLLSGTSESNGPWIARPP